MVAAVLTGMDGLFEDLLDQARIEINAAVERGMAAFGPAQPNGMDLNGQVLVIAGRAHERDWGPDTEDLAEMSRIIDVAREWAPPGQRKRTAVVRATEAVVGTVKDVAADVVQGSGNAGVPVPQPGYPTWVKVGAGVGAAVLVVAVLSELRAWIALLGGK